MIEKIKAWFDAVGRFLIYILTPLAFVGGYIWYLLGKQKKLEEKVADLSRSDRQKELERRIEENEKASEASTRTYAELRDQYLAEHGKGSGVPGLGDSKE